MAVELRTGSIPDRIDERDHSLFSAEVVASLVEQRDGVANRDSGRDTADTGPQSKILTDLPPVYDQGDIGSCTSNAVAAALRYAHFQYKKKSVPEKYEDFQPSRLFLYANARMSQDPDILEKTPTASFSFEELKTKIWHDTGAESRIAIHTVRTLGICTEDLWPYGEPHSLGEDEKLPDESEMFVSDRKKRTPLTAPPPANPIATTDMVGAYKQAKDYFHVLHPDEPVKDMIPPAISYQRIFDPAATGDDETKYNTPPIALLEKCITDGFPFIFGITLYKFGHNLQLNSWDSNGVMNKHESLTNQNKKSRHALLAVGFDRNKAAFFVQNSWGTEWPESHGGPNLKGYCWIPYAYFDPKVKVNDERLTRDFWVIKV